MLIRDFLEQKLAFQPPANPVPPSAGVPVSGKVYDLEELTCAIDAVLDGWWTADRYAHEFEKLLCRFVGVRHAVLTNSGSSANLLALTALTSPKLSGRALRPGDEVITCATSFPTTVNPILQNSLKPVLVDVELGTYNADTSQIESAITPKTRAIMLAHTLGNPFDVDIILDVAKRYDLFVIEDTCDALGAEWEGRKVGTFGDLATLSFYPAHHVTTAEGGAVLTSRVALKPIVESFRDWGRDCWCEPGKDNTCGKRFDWKLGELPFGYDHKYVYSHIGYNLKMTDIQAAIGVAQMRKLPRFVEQRRRNFSQMYERLKAVEERLILPRWSPKANPSWFGFPVTLRDGSADQRRDILQRLEAKGVKTRLLFGGNLIRQPAYHEVPVSVVGDLGNADIVMNRTFWLGVYPGLGVDAIDFAADAVLACLDS